MDCRREVALNSPINAYTVAWKLSPPYPAVESYIKRGGIACGLCQHSIWET